MPFYIALLRGINVSGQKPVKMERLRSMFERLGHTSVQTYIQSGNVVFATPKASGEALEKSIAAAIADEFGFDVPVIVRSASELEKLFAANPLLKKKGIDESRLYVTLLAAKPTAAALAKMSKVKVEPECWVDVGREIFLHCPRGYGQTKLSNTVFERVLGVAATTRNWKTITTLLELTRAAL